MKKNKNITNPVITEYLNGFYEPVNDELGEFRAEAEAERVPIILRDTEALLLRDRKSVV